MRRVQATFACVAAFFVPSGPELQICAGSLVIFIAYMLQIQLQPFKQDTLNWCESMGLRTILFTLFCALALQAPQTGDGVTMTCAVCIFASNLVFVAVVGAQLYAHSSALARVYH